jgi:hypothetical protein
MNPEFQLLLGVVMLSSGISYACWVKFRVWRLRQDLFSIRDELWDRMRACGDLGEPGHRALREFINSLIRVAPWISPFTVLRAIVEEIPPDSSLTDEESVKLVTDVKKKVIARVATYLFFETLTGWFVLFFLVPSFLLAMLSIKALQPFLIKITARTIESREIRDISRLVNVT